MGWFIGITVLLFSPAVAQASLKVTDACQALSRGDTISKKKCVSHAQFYEIKPAFIQACTDFQPDVETRMRCLQSGADGEILKICRSTGWSLASTLSCLRAYPNEGLIKACKKIGPDEEDQLRCVRMGRESVQVEACVELSYDASARIECLQKDVPQFEARRCTVKFRSVGDRMSCLDEVVAIREGQYKRDQKELKGRYLASEPE